MTPFSLYTFPNQIFDHLLLDILLKTQNPKHQDLQFPYIDYDKGICAVKKWECFISSEVIIIRNFMRQHNMVMLLLPIECETMFLKNVAISIWQICSIKQPTLQCHLNILARTYVQISLLSVVRMTDFLLQTVLDRPV